MGIRDMQSFNPRVREGRDDYEELLSGKEIVSIHASVKDATDALLFIPDKIRFQSTRP